MRISEEARHFCLRMRDWLSLSESEIESADRPVIRIGMRPLCAEGEKWSASASRTNAASGLAGRGREDGGREGRLQEVILNAGQ